MKTQFERRMEKRREAQLHMMKAEADGRIVKPVTPGRLFRTRTRQELHCHNCENYVQFMVDLSLEGKHVFNCPVCNHEHYRVVRDGVITSDRWGMDPSQMAMVHTASVISTSVTAMYDSDWASSSTATMTYSSNAYASQYNNRTDYFTSSS